MKILKILAVSCAITIMSSFSVFASWEQVGTQWKYKDEVTDGYVASQWIESTTEKGLWYYLDENGVMAVNTTTPDGYYVNDKGEWREGQNDGNNQGSNTETDISGWKGYTDLNDWGSGGNLNEAFTQEELDRLAEAINNAR